MREIADRKPPRRLFKYTDGSTHRGSEAPAQALPVSSGIADQKPPRRLFDTRRVFTGAVLSQIQNLRAGSTTTTRHRRFKTSAQGSSWVAWLFTPHRLIAD